MAPEADVVVLVVLMIGAWGGRCVVGAVPAKALDVPGCVVVVLQATGGGEKRVATLDLGDLHAPGPDCRGVCRPNGGSHRVARVRGSEVHVLTTQGSANHRWVRSGGVRDDQVVIDAAAYRSSCGGGRRHDKGLKVDPQLADVRGGGADGVRAAGGRSGGALSKLSF